MDLVILLDPGLVNLESNSQKSAYACQDEWREDFFALKQLIAHKLVLVHKHYENEEHVYLATDIHD